MTTPIYLPANTVAGCAAAYATMGWAVVPIPRGSKAPAHPGWNQPGGYVTTPAEALKTWGRGQNMGVVLAPSNVTTIDLDELDQARDALKAVGIDVDAFLNAQDAVRIIGNPIRAKLVYQAPAGFDLSTKILTWPSKAGGDEGHVFELRGGKGQDVLPPSLHPDTNARYRWNRNFWDNGGLPPLPEAFLNLWANWDANELAMKRACPWAVEEPFKPKVAAAKHNPDTRDSFDDFAAEHRLVRPAGGWVRDGEKHRCHVLRADGEVSRGENATYLIYSDGLRGWVENHPQQNGVQWWAPKPTELKVVPPPDPTVKKPPLFVSVKSLMDTDMTPRWFVRGFIEIPSTVRIFGPSGSGKSFVCADLAAKAAGTARAHWMGKRVTNGPVFYIAGEGHVGLKRRFKAWQLHHELEEMPERLYTTTARIALDAAGAELVATEIERMSQEHGVNPVAIVIDTLARAFPPGGNENDTRDMNTFINEVDKIRDRLDCVALIIHHTGHVENNRARGSSAALAAMDGELHAFENGSGRFLQWKKLKDQELDNMEYGFKLKPYVVGQDPTAEEDEPKEITSCAVEWLGKSAASTSITTNPTEAHGLKTLRAAITEGYSATMTAWREAFCENYWAEGASARRTAFSRAKRDLVIKGLVRVDGDYCSINRVRREDWS